jgi:hypothetical protein
MAIKAPKVGAFTKINIDISPYAYLPFKLLVADQEELTTTAGKFEAYRIALQPDLEASISRYPYGVAHARPADRREIASNQRGIH